MKRLFLAVSILFVISLCGKTYADNHAPVVSNVSASQNSSSRKVDIYYDVSDQDGDSLGITIRASDDGGQNYHMYPKSLTGDIGEGITPGTGKHIVWDIMEDYPNRQNSNFKVVVIARDSRGGSTDMVYVPAGSFQMQGQVIYLDAYYIDKYEVTNEDYCSYLNDAMAYGLIDIDLDKYVYDPATGNRLFDANGGANIYFSEGGFYIDTDKENNPVSYVSWYGAKAYAEYIGKRLPTESEWEKAASWNPVDETKTTYAFGNIINQNWCNYNNYYHVKTDIGYFNGTGGRKNAHSWYGCYDMSGNVWEWCSDWYASNYYSTDPGDNPQGPATGMYKVFRGGGWYNNADNVRAAPRYNNTPANLYNGSGFRCAKSAD